MSVNARRNGLRRPSWSASAPESGIATRTNRTTTNWRHGDVPVRPSEVVDHPGPEEADDEQEREGRIREVVERHDSGAGSRTRKERGRTFEA